MIHRWVLYVLLHGTCADTALGANVVLRGGGSETALARVSFFITAIRGSAIETPATFDRRGRTAHTLSQCIEQRILCAFHSVSLDLDLGPRLSSHLRRVLDNSTSSGRIDPLVTSMPRIPPTLLA